MGALAVNSDAERASDLIMQALRYAGYINPQGYCKRTACSVADSYTPFLTCLQLHAPHIF